MYRWPKPGDETGQDKTCHLMDPAVAGCYAAAQIVDENNAEVAYNAGVQSMAPRFHWQFGIF